MLTTRTETILKSIVGQYIARAVPVPSQSIVHDYGLEVSSATIRNEMARLEQEGYIIRPHPSAGSIPSDLGYRYYVESLENIRLPTSQQRMISHLFHQVESRLDEWLSLTATLLAHLAHNMAVVATPKTAQCKYKHVEIVSLQDITALLVLVLEGARVRQQLVTFEQEVTQAELTIVAMKLNTAYSGLSTEQITAKDMTLPPIEQQFRDCILHMMKDRDEEENNKPYFDGLHFMLEQPEFADSSHVQALVGLTERSSLLKNILPRTLPGRGVKVVIGKENESDIIREYSVVLSQYGLPEEAVGTLAIIGPTRMPYAQAIAAIDYVSWLLSQLIARLYGRDEAARSNSEYNGTRSDSSGEREPEERDK